jgi:hypothetical protein
MGTDVAGGINNLETALLHVGQVRALAPLGLDIQTVDAAYKKFIAEGIDKTEAWRQAVLGAADDMAAKVGPAIEDGPGAALKRLSLRWDGFWDGFAVRVSQGVDGFAQLTEAMDKYSNSFQQKGADSRTNPSTNMGGLAAKSPIEALQNQIDEQRMRQLSNYRLNGMSDYGAMQGPLAPGVTAAQNDASNQAYVSQGVIAGYAGSRPRNNMPGLMADQQNADYANSLASQDMRNFTDRNGGAGGTQSWATTADISAQQATVQALKDDASARADDTRLIQSRALAVQDATAKEVAHAAAITSVATAFGLNQNGLYSEAGGTMDSGMATARAARLTEDQHKGMGAGAINKDMAAFDKEAGSAKDAYALATGGATKESLAFRDAEIDAGKALAGGKITVTEYATEIQKLANAAKTGKTSVEELYNIAHPKAAAAEAHTSRDDASDQAIFTSQAKLADVQNNLIKTAGQSVGDATSGASSLTTYLNGVATNADKTATAIDGVTAAMHRSPLLTATQMAAPTTTGPMVAFQQQANKGLDGASPLTKDDPFGPMSKSAGDATTKVTAVGTAINTTGGFLDALVNSSGAKGKQLADGFTLPQTATEKLAATLKIVNDLINKASGTFTFTTNFTLGGGGGGNTSSMRAGAQYQ